MDAAQEFTVNVGEPDEPKPSSPDFIAYLASMEAEATAALGEVTLRKASVGHTNADDLATTSCRGSEAEADSGSNADDEDRNDELSAALASAPMADELEAAEIAAASSAKKKKKKRSKKKKASSNPDCLEEASGNESHHETDPAADSRGTAVAKPTAPSSEAVSSAAAQVSADVLSAHSVLAEFEGRYTAAEMAPTGREHANLAASSSEASAAQTTADVARFRIVKYCKYAHLFPREASGLLKVFDLPLGSAADAQTQQLADEADGSLSVCVAGLKVGDRVELEWLQIRLTLNPPLAPANSERALPLGPAAALPPPPPSEPPTAQQRVVQQCQKLVRLDARAEAALNALYPKPQLMLPKGSGGCAGTAGAICSACTAGAGAAGECACGQNHLKPTPTQQAALCLPVQASSHEERKADEQGAKAKAPPKSLNLCGYRNGSASSQKEDGLTCV